MPTVKPRITITLTDHQHAVLSSLATVQKVSMSSIVVDLVDATLPVLERLASVLQNAANAPQSVLDDLRRSLASAEQDTVGMSSDVMGQLDLLVEASGGGAAVRDAAAARAAVPDSYTTEGMDWWNSIDEDDRAMWLRRAGSASASDAFAAFKRAAAKGRPPTSNRGVRITSPNAKMAPISPMKKGDKNGRAEK